MAHTKPTKYNKKGYNKVARTTKSNSRPTKRPANNNFLQNKIDFKLAVFIILFAAVGAYFLIRSQADSSKAYVLAESATNLTTQANGPRVITEDTGNKRNSKVVYVSAPTNQTNAVKLTHTADKAGIYSICGTGRAVGTATNTAKLVVNTTVNTTNPASKAQAYKPGNDYVGNCFEFTIDKAGTLNIENQVTAGSWRFAMVIVKLIRETETPQPPVSGQFPTPETAGWRHTGVTLTTYSGPCTITEDGTIIDGKDIKCGLRIEANNVTIKRSRIQPSSEAIWGIFVPNGKNLLVQDVEITSKSNTVLTSWGIQNFDGTDMTVERTYIHHTYRGVQPSNGTKILNSYIGDNICIERPGDHNFACDVHSNAIASFGGTSNVTIRGNSIECTNKVSGNVWCTAALSIFPQAQWGPNTNWTIENNLLNTTSYYCAYAGYTPPGEKPNRNIKFINNTFGNKHNARCGKSSYMTWANENVGPTPNANGNVFSGNVDGNGNPISI